MMQPIQKKRPIQQTLEELDVLIRARYPVLYLITHEENRLLNLIAQIAKRQSKVLYTWSTVQGLVRKAELNGQPTSVTVNSPGLEASDPLEVLKQIQEKNVAAFFVLYDFHPYLEDPFTVRRLREVAQDLKGTYKTIILVSPRLNLPPELEKDITLVDIPLPDKEELFDVLKSVCTAVAKHNSNTVKLNADDAWALASAAQGLTLTEAENVFSKTIVHSSMIDRSGIGLVLEEKKQIIRKSGILEFFPAEQKLDQVGGLQNLKTWLTSRGKAFSNRAVEYGLPAPKGVLLLGAPGCGKSLTAKAISSLWQLPLLRLDFGKIFSGLVGSSEENIRRALTVAEGVAPAILWIDEIEKGLAGGGGGGQSDSGTAARVLSTFLTWMQEKQSKVFVIATANRIDLLPPELLRRGRFDDIFFLDLPGVESRSEILDIHLRAKKRDPKHFDLLAIAQLMDGFSGSEVEHCIVEGLFTSYAQQRDLTTEDLISAARALVPLSVTYREELEKTRKWASTRARLADNPPLGRADSNQRITKLEVHGVKKAV